MGIMSPRASGDGCRTARVPAPPYDLVDNPNSPLDVTDLVQVDAMMTGYSRPGVGVKATDLPVPRTTSRCSVSSSAITSTSTIVGRHRSICSARATARSARPGSRRSCRRTKASSSTASCCSARCSTSSTSRRRRRTTSAYAHVPADVHGDGVVSQEARRADLQGQTLQQVVQQARDYAFGDYLTALAKGNTLSTRRADGRGAKAGAAHRAVAAFMLEHQSPHRCRARSAPSCCAIERVDARPLRQPHHRHQRQRRRISARTTIHRTSRRRARSWRRSCATCTTI